MLKLGLTLSNMQTVGGVSEPAEATCHLGIRKYHSSCSCQAPPRPGDAAAMEGDGGPGAQGEGPALGFTFQLAFGEI